MKKSKKIIISLLLVVALVIGILLIFKSNINNTKTPLVINTIEYQSKGNSKVIENIDKQLKNIDIKNLLNKKDLILEKNINELQNNINSGKLTYEELTAFYLYRIKLYDQSEKGFNSVITVNKNAINLAKFCDENSDDKNSLLYGIPVALKDNINTLDMPTTAGSVALADFIPSEDADIVEKLKKEGAIIIAKTNLSEFANFKGYTMPSGYNDLKGQNMNPYDPENLTTWGSSSGSATFATCNFSSVAIGTETTGSIVAPSSVQGVVGFRPSLGKVSKEGIIPLSHSLDTAGPVTRTVLDSAILYNTMSNDDIDITTLDKDYLKGKNIGIFESYKDSSHIDTLRDSLKSSGANITYLTIDQSNINNIDILLAEFRTDLNNYLTTYNAPVKSLDEIIKFYKDDMENRAKYGMEFLELAQEPSDLTEVAIKNRMNIAKEIVENAFNEYQLDGIVFINNDYSLLACMSGSPEITVPLYIKGKEPIGATFMTIPNEDIKALNIAYSFENYTNARKVPEF